MKYNVSYKRDGVFQSILINADDEATAAAYLSACETDAEIIGTKPATRDDERPGKPVLTVPADFKPEPAEDVTTEATETPATKPAETTENVTEPAALPIGAQTFPRLYRLIMKHYNAEAAKMRFYIRRGYFPDWATEHRNNPDRAIKKYLTPARLAKYERGEMPRAEAIKHATARALREVESYRAEKTEQLNAAAIATAPDCVAVFVTWTRSRVWGYNPRAEVRTGADYWNTTTGSASGCGYDKQSAAIAEALNKSPAVLRALYEVAERAAKRGAKLPEAGALWRDVLGYGSGYNVLPYFEGGCGVSCISAILSAAGLPLSETFETSAQNTYIYTAKASAKK